MSEKRLKRTRNSHFGAELTFSLRPSRRLSSPFSSQSHRHSHKSARHHPHGGLPSWAMYSAIGFVVLGILGGAWYFLVGPGAGPSSGSTGSSSSTRTTPATGGTATGGGGGATGSGASASKSSATGKSSATSGTAAGGTTEGGATTGAGGAATTTQDETAAPSPTSGGGGGASASSNGKVISAFYETWGALEVADIAFQKCESSASPLGNPFRSSVLSC